jgi:hypothetical protein
MHECTLKEVKEIMELCLLDKIIHIQAVKALGVARG